MKKLKRLLSKVGSIPRYIRVSGSIDFMRRYLVLAFLYLINTILLGALGKVVSKAHMLFHKAFIFRTPFGTFLGSTVNQWTVLIPDYEPEIQHVIHKNIKRIMHQPEKIFLNIGSHIGRYAIELSKNYGYTSYCFEPSPQTFKTLKINSILSNVEDKMHLYNFCLGEKDGMTLFEYVSDNDASSKMASQNAESRDQRAEGNKEAFIEVPVRRYDSLGLNITPDLIIIDVEGFEYDVLLGMSELLSRIEQCDIIIEIMPDTARKHETIALMQGYGFSYTWADDHDAHFFKA